MGDGKFSVKITDNERKIYVNLAMGNDAALQQALILIGTDAAEVPTIIASSRIGSTAMTTPTLTALSRSFTRAWSLPTKRKMVPLMI